MIPFVKGFLMDNWQGLGLGERPDDLLFVKFADRRIRASEVGIVSFLVKKVSGGKEEPLIVLRLPRYFNNEAAKATLAGEYKNLVSIHKRLGDPEILSAIPRPVVWEEIDHHRVLGVSFLAGSDLSDGMVSARILESYVERYDLAFDWLIKFQKKLDPRNNISVTELAKKVIGDFRASFSGNVGPVEKYLSVLQGRAGKLERKNCPLFPQHADFHAENIFLSGGKVSGVVDWEDFDPEGIPAFDLFHFIKTYFEALFDYFGKKGDVAAIEKLSSDRDIIRVIKMTEEKYFQAMGIDPELSQVLLPLYLIRSVNLAADPRKKAMAAMKRMILLLQLGPFDIYDLFLFMSLGAYVPIYRRAAAQKDQALAKLCQERIANIQRTAEQKRGSQA